MKVRGMVLVVVGALIASSSFAMAAAEGCADPKAELGEWRSYGGDLANSRTQKAGTISASTAGALKPAWKFSASAAQAGGGTFSNTPVVADGCVFLGSNTGFVFAVNADTGALVWKSSRLPGAGQTLLGGVIVGSPVVANGVVFVGVSRPGTPYVAALDQDTGAVLWTAVVEGFSAETVQTNALINASPVYHDGMIFMGFSGNEGGSVARGGFAIVDASRECSQAPEPWKEGAPAARTCANPVDGATGGTLLAHEWTINDAEYAAGYRGASIWCTAAIDPIDNHAYACGGNP
ncbi:MAG TPA: PQQ-binding-like beta-propeller repeat protein, partial [Actinomycetota bacterium]|nr:PQQ-binding-like beta-propeller repeat protein [Actinomycetota bacterium]